MNLYKLTGTYRKQTSIGKFLPFRVEIRAENPLDAMKNQREIYYLAGYDHVLFKTTRIRQNGRWVEIPMMKALGLE